MEVKYNILVVDDEKDIRDVVEIYLINGGFNVITAEDGIEALEVLKNEKIDLIILDIMMPRLDGVRACMKIRETQQIPIIMLSAKTEDSDKILGLNIGADDYITKPFNPLELVARVNSQIRRTKVFTETNEKDEYSVGALTLNSETREVFVEGKFVRLTPREFDILEVLLINIGRVLSTEQIYERVWKEDFCNSDNTVAVHIRNIREKIEINPKDPKYIKLVWGVGYKIEK
ncbi:DNA-binding response regulator, OmpR family, contains REC and winged-helix (wHTH) domain [Clostridium cavendishii DSM 21758]|uniref:Stage 0 sporulation protein A homolog n=1 Tax=Clostridium cavendishii DSM 21758 TaxID=1121302 RepID=A0A1M6UNL5_9CLOT|nr:response regulator transcription factor [Clostridium cavendishii]SHK70768.1 DNA-binding response regulator, OmpR family, contains REC and winged-helix (wHTH) domain [Clostridium cavendishii DSM 21758]